RRRGAPTPPRGVRAAGRASRSRRLAWSPASVVIVARLFRVGSRRSRLFSDDGGRRRHRPARAVSSRSDTGEQPIEVRRYLDALRRSLPLIVAITLALALTAFVVSSL